MPPAYDSYYRPGPRRPKRPHPRGHVPQGNAYGYWRNRGGFQPERGFRGPERPSQMVNPYVGRQMRDGGRNFGQFRPGMYQQGFRNFSPYGIRAGDQRRQQDPREQMRQRQRRRPGEDNTYNQRRGDRDWRRDRFPGPGYDPMRRGQRRGEDMGRKRRPRPRGPGMPPGEPDWVNGLPNDAQFMDEKKRLDDQLDDILMRIGLNEREVQAARELFQTRFFTDQQEDVRRVDEAANERGIYNSTIRKDNQQDLERQYARNFQDYETDYGRNIFDLQQGRIDAGSAYEKSLADALAAYQKRLLAEPPSTVASGKNGYPKTYEDQGYGGRGGRRRGNKSGGRRGRRGSKRR